MKKTYKALNARYAVLQFGYWVFSLVIGGFAAVFLEGRGFTAGGIGTVTGFSALAACILQPAAAAFADRHLEVPLKLVTAGFVAVDLVSVLIMLAFPESFAATFVFFTLAHCTMMSLQPLVNTLGIQFTNVGENLNFGLGRAAGSLGYASSSYFMGLVTERYGGEIILPVLVGVLAVYLILLLVFPRPDVAALKDAIARQTRKGTKGEKPSTYPEFFRRYRRFDLLMLAFTLTYLFNNWNTTYMLYVLEPIGGTSVDIGYSLAVAAFSELPVVAVGIPVMKKIGAERCLRISSLAFFANAILIYFAPDPAFFIASRATQCLSTAMTIVSSVYYVNNIVGKQDNVKGQAVMGVVAVGIVNIIANFGGGHLLDVCPVKTIIGIGIVLNALGVVVMYLATSKHVFPGEEKGAWPRKLDL